MSIFNRMLFIAVGRTKNAFTAWKEFLDKYKRVGEAKRARVIDRLIKASMTKEQKAYTEWKVLVFEERRKEQLMKHSISCMLKTAGLM